MDVRCGVRTARLVYKELYCTRRSDVRTVNGFVLRPRDRGLEYASLKYRRRNSVIIIASLLEYKRASAIYPTNFNMVPPTSRETISDQCNVLIIFDLVFDHFTKSFGSTWQVLSFILVFIIFPF